MPNLFQLKSYGLVDDNGDVLFPYYKVEMARLFHQITGKIGKLSSVRTKE